VRKDGGKLKIDGKVSAATGDTAVRHCRRLDILDTSHEVQKTPQNLPHLGRAVLLPRHGLITLSRKMFQSRTICDVRRL